MSYSLYKVKKEINNNSENLFQKIKRWIINCLKFLIKSIYNLTLGLLVKLFKKANKSLDDFSQK